MDWFQRRRGSVTLFDGSPTSPRPRFGSSPPSPRVSPDKPPGPNVSPEQAEHEAVVVEYERKLQVLTVCLEEKAEENISLTLANDELKHKMKELEAKVRELEENNNALQRQYNDEKALSEKFESQINQLSNQLDVLNATIANNATNSAPSTASSSTRGGHGRRAPSHRRSTTMPLSPAFIASLSTANAAGGGEDESDKATLTTSSAPEQPTTPTSASSFLQSITALVSPSKRATPEKNELSSSTDSATSARVAALEKDMSRMKFALLLAQEKERSLRGSVEVYEEELKRVKQEGITNLRMEGLRIEALEDQIHHLQEKIDELEFLMGDSGETAIDFSESAEESVETADSDDEAIIGKLEKSNSSEGSDDASERRTSPRAIEKARKGGLSQSDSARVRISRGSTGRSPRSPSKMPLKESSPKLGRKLGVHVAPGRRRKSDETVETAGGVQRFLIKRRSNSENNIATLPSPEDIQDT